MNRAKVGMRIQVESSTNHDGMPIPRRFRLDGSRIDVVETLDQWHGPDYRYVKVKCDNGGLYILRFDESRGAWDLTMFQSERIQTLSAQLYDRASFCASRARSTTFVSGPCCRPKNG